MTADGKIDNSLIYVYLMVLPMELTLSNRHTVIKVIEIWNLFWKVKIYNDQ